MTGSSHALLYGLGGGGVLSSFVPPFVFPLFPLLFPWCVLLFIGMGQVPRGQGDPQRAARTMGKCVHRHDLDRSHTIHEKAAETLMEVGVRDIHVLKYGATGAKALNLERPEDGPFKLIHLYRYIKAALCGLGGH